MIEKAVEFAKKYHAGQKRHDGSPYFSHVEAVAKDVESRGCNDSYIVVAYLHDILEDCDVDKAQLIDEFGGEIADIVELLTRKSGETYFDFIFRIVNTESYIGHVACVVKLADLRHNMSTLVEGSMKDKYRFAYFIIEKTLFVY